MSDSKPRQLVLPLDGPGGLLLPDQGRREQHEPERAIHAAILALEGLTDVEISSFLDADRKTLKRDREKIAQALRTGLLAAGFTQPPRK